MKHIYTILFAFLVSGLVMAQAPEKMSYQAVIRDADNSLLLNSTVGMQISILQGSSTGTEVYVETHSPTTNANGLVSLIIGEGTIVSGDFATIDWALGPYFIKTETDPLGGTNYTISGTNQLLSVPYALYAENSGSSIPGPEGAMGPPGEDGEDGEIGDTGLQGEQGIQGDQGDPGLDGEQGIQGEQGLQGDQGDQGDQGGQGIQGLVGPAGDDGIDGSVGATGPQGDQGDQGSQGIQGIDGPAGDDGIDGSIGATGPQGDQGSQGIQGAQGFQGDEGLQGPQGDDGFDGPEGPEGPQGPQGEPGTSLTAGDGIEIIDGVINYDPPTYVNVPLFIGDYKQGGVVFYVAPDGQHGLVCSIQDQSSAVTWYQGQNLISNPNSFDIDGQDYVDWRWPTENELTLMYNNRVTIDATAGFNGGSSFSTDYYWSSTEFDYLNGLLRYFTDGLLYQAAKSSSSYSIRAVREIYEPFQ